MPFLLADITFLLSDTKLYFYDASNNRTEDIPGLYDTTIELFSYDPNSVVLNGALWHLAGPEEVVGACQKAAERGAIACIVSHDDLRELDAKQFVGKDKLLFVAMPDPSTGLLNLARKWRATLSMPIIAVTGTVGKSMTIEMFRLVTQHAGVSAFMAPEGSGTLHDVALALLSVDSSYSLACFEVGAHQPGEIAPVADLLKPTMAVITPISHVHMPYFANSGELAREYAKIFTHYTPSQIGIVCGDYPELAQGYYEHPIVRFGTQYKNEFSINRLQVKYTATGQPYLTGMFHIFNTTHQITLQSNHVGAVYAACAAATLGYFLNIAPKLLIAAVEQFRGMPGRFELRPFAEHAGLLVNDTCVAHPDSMKAAIAAFHEQRQYSNKIAVLGDMLGLGEREVYWHRQMGREIMKARSINTLVLVGERARRIADTAPVTVPIYPARDADEACEFVENLIKKKPSLVLATADRSLNLQRLSSQL